MIFELVENLAKYFIMSLDKHLFITFISVFFFYYLSFILNFC